MMKKWLFLLLTLMVLIISCSSVVAAKPRIAGTPIPANQLTVAGVSIGAKADDVIRSLGKPTSIKNVTRSMFPGKILNYGGISYECTYFYTNDGIKSLDVYMITVTNRDATVMGIAVGDPSDTLWKIFNRQPDSTKKDIDGSTICFFGTYMPYTDRVSGVEFYIKKENGASIISKIQVIDTF